MISPSHFPGPKYQGVLVFDQTGPTRRHVLKAAAAGAAALVLAPARHVLAQAPQPGNVVRLADDLFLLQIPGEANVLAQTTSGGVLLVDGASAAGADALLAAVAALPGGGPVHTLFNTHWHPEQTGSN